MVPPFDVNHLQIANCSNLSIVYCFWAILGKHCLHNRAMKMLTRKSYDCAGTAFVQGDSAGGSKLIEQALSQLSKCLNFGVIQGDWTDQMI